MLYGVLSSYGCCFGCAFGATVCCGAKTMSKLRVFLHVYHYDRGYMVESFEFNDASATRDTNNVLLVLKHDVRIAEFKDWLYWVMVE